MAATLTLTHGGVAALQAEEEKSEPPEENKAMAAAVAAPCPWTAAVAERYERHEKLGEGMFGDVYRAWDRVNERFVALKRLAGRTEGGFVFVETCVRDFAQQATSLASCRGRPSVVQLLAAHAHSGRGDGDCFLVTECAGPMNLRQYMLLRRREGLPFEEGEVRDAMRQLLAGVKSAHDAGVLHREIVPENVAVGQEDMSADGVVVGRRMIYTICGFGMSEPAAGEKDDSGLLASPSPYRAPELFLGSKDYDGRVDTWGLGCIMAELLAGTGVPFFGGKMDTGVLEEMMYVVGARGIVKWPGLDRVAARLRKLYGRDGGHLRQVFPREVLSPAGFKVLKGLLRSHPDRRLTAAGALRMPWFGRRSLGGCFGGAGLSAN